MICCARCGEELRVMTMFPAPYDMGVGAGASVCISCLVEIMKERRR